MPFSTEDEIALVGVGAMGAPIVRHLVGAGFPVVACDLDAGRRARAEELGARSGPTDSRTLRELEEMRFTWYEKDIDNAVRMAATVDRELVLSPFVRRLMRDIDVPAMAALLEDRGIIELSGSPDAAAKA